MQLGEPIPAKTSESELLKRLADNVPAMLAYWDSTLRCRFANAAYRRWFRMSSDRVLGRHMRELLGRDLYRLNLPHVERVLRGEPLEFETAVPDPRGGPSRHTLVYFLPDVVGGFVRGFFVTVTDISEVKRAELAVRESDERLSLALAASHQGLWDWDIPADTAYLSTEYLELTGGGEARVRSAIEWFHDSIHPDDLPAVQRTMEEHLKGNSAVSVIEYRLRKQKDGRHVWFRGVGRVTARDARGAPVRMTGVISDITAQKDAEEALRATLQSRKDLLSIVSHDVRSPLTTILLGARILSQAPPSGERRRGRHHVDAIIRATEHMKRLIDDLLADATLEAGTFAVEPSVEGIGPIVDEVLESFDAVAASKKVKLERLVPEALPRARCERHRIVQALTNLVGNAIKFVAPGGAVRVRVAHVESELVVEVSDNGPGIPEASLAHVFDRYWSADGTTRRGVGLGLFITKSIVEAHGGRIGVESTVGSGTTFRFTLPAAGD